MAAQQFLHLSDGETQPCSTVGWAGTANGEHRRQRGAEAARQVVGGGVAAEGACEGSLGEEFGEEFGEKAGESPVTRGRSSQPRGVALPAKGAGQSSPRTMFPSVLVCTAHGDPLLSTARTHVRMPLPRRSWAFDQPVLVTFRTFCLAVCAVTALQLLSASGSRWGGHRVPFGNGRVTPCRSDAALLQRPYGGALEDLSVRGEAGAVARAFRTALTRNLRVGVAAGLHAREHVNGVPPLARRPCATGHGFGIALLAARPICRVPGVRRTPTTCRKAPSLVLRRPQARGGADGACSGSAGRQG